MTPNQYPALLLNADLRPMSVVPMSLLGWQDSITAVMANRVEVLENYDRFVHSGGNRITMPIPSVVYTKAYQKQTRPVAFTRAGVLVRAKGLCAYCHARLNMRNLTFDHVVPQCMGGTTSWGNCVASCAKCNARKGSRPLGELRSIGMALLDYPVIPNKSQLNALAFEHFPIPSQRVHSTWRSYLGMEDMEPAADNAVTDVSSQVFPEGMTSADYWHVELAT